MTTRNPAPTPRRCLLGRWPRAAALLAAACLTVGLPPRRVLGASGEITTYAGGLLDEGPAVDIGQRPGAVAVHGTLVYVVDDVRAVVRRLDTSTGNETIIAGGGDGPDGGPATAARLTDPHGIAVDAAGDLFIAEALGNRVRRVDAVTGIIVTVAGTGTFGFTGDGGLATAATLDYPVDVAVDGVGTLWIVDASNVRIRRVDGVNGIITTVAGSGSSTFAGDGGPATAAGLWPAAVAVDGAGDLFITDVGNARVRRVDALSGIITTVAGNGTVGSGGDGSPATAAELNTPVDIAVDAAGNLFIADEYANRVRRIDAVSGAISTAVGNGTYGFEGDPGPISSAELAYPQGVAVSDDGSLWIADSGNNRLRCVLAATPDVIQTFAGNGLASGGFGGDGGLATAAQLARPTDVALDVGDNLFIADPETHRVRRVDAATGVITTFAGDGSAGFGGDGGPATAAQLAYPVRVVLDADRNLFIADPGNLRVRRVDAATGLISTVAGDGEWGFAGDGGPATAAQLTAPQDLTIDGTGNLFIADGSRRCTSRPTSCTSETHIRRVDAVTGVITTVVQTATEVPGIVADGSGGLFTIDFTPSGYRGLSTLSRIDPATGAVTPVFSGGFAPTGLTLDAAGTPVFSDVFTSMVFAENIYGKTVLSPVKPIAGNGTDGFDGDGGQATAAELSQPAGVVFDGAANFYIADSGNHRIRRVENPCGNGTIDTGEECDDGNHTAGDGCGPRCLRECGNGVVDPGEECDDGNWSDADCCLSTCRFSAAGTPCSADGDLCAAAFCDASGSCLQEPRPGMNCWKPSGPGRSSLFMQEGVSHAGDRVSWSWAGRLANFGNPRSDTSYALCVYDDTTGRGPARLRLRLDAPATPTCHEGCWFRIRKGWKYITTDERPDGVDSVRLEARGFRRAHLTFVGRGANLGPLGLPYTPGVTVQLRASTGQCWETDFSRPARNTPARFRARAGR